MYSFPLSRLLVLAMIASSVFRGGVIGSATEPASHGVAAEDVRKLIAGQRSVVFYGGVGRLNLLSSDPLASKLRLRPKQRVLISEVQERTRLRNEDLGRVDFKGAAGLSEEEARSRLLPLQAVVNNRFRKADSDLAEILSAEQYELLLSAQANAVGPRVLTDEVFVNHFSLSKDQVARLRSARSSIRRAALDPDSLAGDAVYDTVRRYLDEIDALESAMLSTLSEGQRSKWESLVKLHSQ